MQIVSTLFKLLSQYYKLWLWYINKNGENNLLKNVTLWNEIPLNKINKYRNHDVVT